MGIIPQDAGLTARPAAISAWEAVPDDLKPVLARQMELYAGFMDHTDYQVGRVIDAIGELGILDDALIVYINSDNGASAEAGPNDAKDADHLITPEERWQIAMARQ